MPLIEVEVDPKPEPVDEGPVEEDVETTFVKDREEDDVVLPMMGPPLEEVDEAEREDRLEKVLLLELDPNDETDDEPVDIEVQPELVPVTEVDTPVLRDHGPEL